MRCFFGMKALPPQPSSRRANSSSIVLLFEALSHVTYPTYCFISTCITTCLEVTNLMGNPHTIDNLEQCLAQSSPTVRIIKQRKTNYRTLKFPYANRQLLDPVSSDGEVGLNICRLPCITCQIDSARYSLTLQDISGCSDLT